MLTYALASKFGYTARIPPEISLKPEKRTQERTEVTRQKLLAAASHLFSYQGYEGVTVSDIEKAAGVHRGLVGYHFENKESLWKAVAEASFGQMRGQIDQRLTILKEISKTERLALIVRFYVHFNAQHPEISALVSQEARHDSWRIRYLLDNHIRPASTMQLSPSEIPMPAFAPRRQFSPMLITSVPPPDRVPMIEALPPTSLCSPTITPWLIRPSIMAEPSVPALKLQ